MASMNVSFPNDESLREQYHFSPADYAVFGLMLLLSLLTGLYHGCRGRSQLTARRYLMGSDMQVFPVAMSLIASYVSGVTVLGTPAEIYNYGTQYCAIVLAIWAMGLIVSAVYLPVFCGLKLDSSYEYLKLRFDGRVRAAASILFILDEVMFLPILLYVPALAFNQVTGMDVHVIGSAVCGVCVFYTVIGGLKAVVWTDTLQICVMFVSVVAVVAVGSASLGGPSGVLAEARRGGRLIFFNTDPSLYERHTLWSVLVGGGFYWTAFNAVNQTMVQRYLSLPTLRHSRSALGLFAVGVSLFVLLCCYCGLLVFAAYGRCDPRSLGTVLNDDQLLPVFVLGAVGPWAPGLVGLFVAGVFGAALSSLSVALNATSGVLLQDVARGLCGLRPGDAAATALARASVLALGAAALAGLFAVERLGGVLAAASSLSAIAAGTTFGVFSLGMLVPWCSADGALVGALVGALCSGWLSLGGQYAKAAGQLASRALPVSTAECAPNATLWRRPEPTLDAAFAPYRLSYHWIAPVGVCSTLLAGMVASLALGKASDVDPRLLSPVTRTLTFFKASRHSSISELKDTQETMFAAT